MKTKKKTAKLTKRNGRLAVDWIEDDLRARVRKMFAAGEVALPQELELAKEYGVSRMTVRAALASLKADQTIKSIPGKGTFVVPPSERQRPTLVLCDNLRHPFDAMAVDTAMQVLSEHGTVAFMTPIHNGDGGNAQLNLSSEEIGAALIIAGESRSIWQELIGKLEVPSVVLTDFNETVRLPPFCHQVVPDQRAAVFMATRKLLEEGHRRIMLGAWVAENAWGRDAQRGYREALEDAGVELDEELIVPLPDACIDIEKGHYLEGLGAMRQRVDKQLAGTNPPTALVHNSALETQLSEMLRLYFRDRFDPGVVIGTGFDELLASGYRGAGESWAVAMPFRRLVELALDLLARPVTPKSSPNRLVVDAYCILKRQGGEWQPVTG